MLSICKTSFVYQVPIFRVLCATCTYETSDEANVGERAQAAGDDVAGGASGGNGKKREREAGGG